MSAWSAPHNHPEDAVTTDPPRPSEDPADAMGDDEHRPDAPTEPPDMPEGMRRRGTWERVEKRVSGASRGVQEDLGVDGDEERRPGWPDEPPDKPYGAPRDPDRVQAEPGGKTAVEQDGSAAHEDADATIDGRAEEAHSTVQVEGENTKRC